MLRAVGGGCCQLADTGGAVDRRAVVPTRVATYTVDMGPARRLSHHYQVRFDEADAQGLLRPSGYLRYAQDMAWRHSESAGFGRDWYAERALTWLVRNVSLHIRAAVTYGEVVGLTTEVVGWRHVWARRQGVMRRGTGGNEPAAADGSAAADESASSEVVAVVDTDWVLLGGDGRPARMPVEIADWFAAEPTFERRRVLIPATPPSPCAWPRACGRWRWTPWAT